MKTSDWITLAVGIGTILATFAGAWLGAYFSGKNASKQSVNSIVLQQNYERFQKAINDTEDNIRLLSQMDTNIRFLISTMKQSLNYTGSSLNPDNVIDLTFEIKNILEGFSNEGLKVSTKLHRRIRVFEIEAKNLSSSIELLVNKNINDESEQKIKSSLDTFLKEAEEIKLKVNLELDQIKVKLIKLRQEQKVIA